MPLGEIQYLDLAPFIGRKEQQVSVYFKLDGTDATLVKLDATVTIRPSASKVTSKSNFKCPSTIPFASTKFEPEFLDLQSDPELNQVWNHPVYQADYQQMIVAKDKEFMTNIIAQMQEVMDEI